MIQLKKARMTASAPSNWLLRAGIFSVLALAVFPLLVIYIAVRAVGRRPLVGVRQKISGTPPLNVRQGAVLIHGVSLGETALMRPLVPQIQALGAHCLLTTTTETGWRGLEQNFPEQPRAFLPFDLPWAVERFLARSKPAAVILLEAEFWPLWLCACFRRGIPVLLLNARVSPRSYARFAHVRALVAPLLRNYAAAVTQNGLYAARLRRLGCPIARPGGSLKADQVRLADASQVIAEGERLGLIAGDPVLLLASTSSGEEATVLRAWLAQKQLAHPQPAWQIIICPRHPERGPELVTLCNALGLIAVRSANGERLPSGSSRPVVIIVDEIGRLGALYGWCADAQGIAVVGGGLGSGRGGQNMFEAAAARCATVVGWDVRSQPDSMALLRACAGVVEVTDATLAADLAALAADPARRARLGEAGHAAWQAGQGSTARVMRIITPVLRASLQKSATSLFSL